MTSGRSIDGFVPSLIPWPQSADYCPDSNRDTKVQQDIQKKPQDAGRKDF